MAHLFFSIVVVSLNPGDKLFSTLQSILDQDYGNFEIIIKDGGSTDGSVQRLFGEGTERKIPADSRIRFFSGAGQRHLRWNESGGSKSTGAVCAFPELRGSVF